MTAEGVRSIRGKPSGRLAYVVWPVALGIEWLRTKEMAE